ncbi:enoyl-CoA hydratase/isomerase family protein [Cryobacterium algoritolerans]|uniref:Enoyl-CoA hydratase/isomerase family protein n=1 Tax=Cryobacterium algoritolerans TaxID=1259184 RepID=A0A4R8WYV5_9MICO|nr:enoyl-CoA hydratase/isomerase family protein [Cryobacterium algoritolerans]TFC19809.1 enoyl-CoA hydratase/isomerase family protein [Cryobacterium algoritolerans]
MIELTIRDDVAHVVLNAPDKLNALDETALAELDAAYQAAEAAGVRALVLRGEGRAFCAGRDIAGVDPRSDDVMGFLGGLVTPLLTRMSAFPAPTFAVAHGACLGVGLGLLIATDVVYVADTAKIGSPFANLGATLDSGGHALFVERLGAHRTLDLIYSGRLMSGAEAVSAGLFSQVFPADLVQSSTEEAAVRAATGATQAFLASKELVRALRDDRLGLWESVAAENRAQAALCATADYREGFAAFQEKRRPVFTGRD